LDSTVEVPPHEICYCVAGGEALRQLIVAGRKSSQYLCGALSTANGNPGSIHALWTNARIETSDVCAEQGSASQMGARSGDVGTTLAIGMRAVKEIKVVQNPEFDRLLYVLQGGAGSDDGSESAIVLLARPAPHMARNASGNRSQLLEV